MKRLESIDEASQRPLLDRCYESLCRPSAPAPWLNSQNNQRKKFYLHPGQLYATAEGCVVTTILGSCVAVCLYDHHAQIGGINHFLLPLAGRNEQNSHRFGDGAVSGLIAQIIRLGADFHRLQAKIFGGANVIEAFRDRKNHLGTQNIRIARELLESAGVPVISEDVGGHRGRKLVFQTDDGAAWIKEL